MLWILLIILFPIPGTALFLLLGANLITSKTFRELIKSTADSKKYYVQDETVLKELVDKAVMCSTTEEVLALVEEYTN